MLHEAALSIMDNDALKIESHIEIGNSQTKYGQIKYVPAGNVMRMSNIIILTLPSLVSEH